MTLPHWYGPDELDEDEESGIEELDDFEDEDDDDEEDDDDDEEDDWSDAIGFPDIE